MATRSKAAPLNILKDPEDPQPIEILERAIVDVAEGARKLLGSRLHKRAILTLLKDSTRIDKTTIEKVLDHAAKLDKTYLKALVLAAAAIGSLTACAAML